MMMRFSSNSHIRAGSLRWRGLPFLLGFVLLAGGCQMPALPFLATTQPTNAPINEPSPTTAAPAESPATATFAPVPSATPTALPTETPTPTPALPPAERLADAERAERNGDCAQATQSLQAILQDPAAGDLEPEARFLLARCQLQEGDLAAAEDNLTTLRKQFPQSSRQTPALFLLSQAQERMGKLDAAAESLEAYLKARPELAAYLYKRLGDLYLGQQNVERAVAVYRQAQEAAPTGSLRVAYQEDVAAAYLSVQDVAAAVKEYDSILSTARIPEYRSKIEYLAGVAYLGAGDQEQAIARFQLAVGESETSSFAHAALVQLVDLEAKTDELRRGLIDYHNEAYWPAITAFTRSLEQSPDTRPAEAHYYMGLSYARVGADPEARAQYEVVIKSFPKSEVWGDAWMARARLTARAGDVDGARKQYTIFAAANPQHPLAPQALLGAATLAEDAGQFVEAAREYQALAKAQPDYAGEERVLRRAALCLYRLGRHADSAALWEQIAAQPPSVEDGLEARFWAGKARLILGETEPALAHLRQLYSSAPAEYYGQRAAELLQANGAAPTTTTAPVDAAGTDAEAAERWLAARLNVSLEQVQRNTASEIAALPALARGQELWEIGLNTEATGEFDAVRESYAGDAVHLYALTRWFDARRHGRQAILCAGQLIDQLGSSWEQVPLFLKQLCYPTYFSDLIEPEAQRQALDARLVYSVVRQESLFQGQATSWVSAQGLMQVMPATGEWIASQIGWRNFNTEQLYRPYVNVEFGVYYLMRQLQAFDADLVSALAAYNAGPGNASRWRAAAGADDPDLIYALVDISETRLYIRNVTRNYYFYQELYPDGNSQ